MSLPTSKLILLFTFSNITFISDSVLILSGLSCYCFDQEGPASTEKKTVADKNKHELLTSQLIHQKKTKGVIERP